MIKAYIQGNDGYHHYTVYYNVAWGTRNRKIY